MFKYEVKIDSKGQQYIVPNVTGSKLISHPKLNKGTGFSHQERIKFGLTAKLPYHVESLEVQVKKSYAQFLEIKDPLRKNIYLNQLHDYNETLFYALLLEHVDEMLPIVYTPTIGDAVESFSLEFRRPRGLFISYPQIEHIEDMLDQRINEEVDLILVTDGEGVLGIGDWGAGGIHIAIGKLMVYTACGGLNPHRVLPIQLDVGTNNKKLLNDPKYLGWRHERINGEDYDHFIDAFVKAVQKKFPNVYLHWEDFGRDNARKNLLRYRDEMATFNDDMQGTGATALACVLSGLVSIRQDIKDQRIVFLGAGTAGCGIADQICMAMVEAGLSEEEARSQIWLVDRPGLLTSDMDNLAFFQAPYAKSLGEVSNWIIDQDGQIGLYEVVNNIKPTILIGCSTVHGAFDERIVKKMAEHCERPIILPLSNPTSKSEATPHDLIHWTDGKVLLACGSPFEPVEYKGTTYEVSQSNNAFVFPGLGRGIIAAKANRVTDGMIRSACQALSQASPARQNPNAPLLPNIVDAHLVSDQIALAVANKAMSEGVSMMPEEADFDAIIKNGKWIPEYLPYRSE